MNPKIDKKNPRKIEEIVVGVVSCVSPKINHLFASVVVQFADSKHPTDPADELDVLLLISGLERSGP